MVHAAAALWWGHKGWHGACAWTALQPSAAEVYSSHVCGFGQPDTSVLFERKPLFVYSYHALRCFGADIVGFTDMSKEVAPIEVMAFLNGLYSAYDALCDELGVYKVETVGDCYVSCVTSMCHSHQHARPDRGTGGRWPSGQLRGMFMQWREAADVGVPGPEVMLWVGAYRMGGGAYMGRRLHA